MASCEDGDQQPGKFCDSPVITERSGVIVAANATALRVLGYEGEPEQLLGTSTQSLLAEQDGVAWPSARAPHIPGLPLRRRDGALVTFEAIGVATPGKLETQVFLRDLSAQRHIEQRLLLAEQMASLGTLLAGVAHELNNPLQYVIANLQFLSEELDGAAAHPTLEDHRRRAMLELVAQAAEGARRMASITSDIRNFSRVSSSEPELCDARAALDGAINLAAADLRSRASVERSYDDVPMVRCQAVRLGQVLVNLLVNAAHSIPLGHPIQRIHVSLQARDDRVCIEVADSGVGIAPEHLGHIFEPFFTTKAKGHGTGLGLFICQQVVAGCGGEITVDSVVGKGTTFRVWLPAADPLAVATGATSTARRARKGPCVRVLVVEDEAAIALVIARILRGHDVTVAASGREALASLRSGMTYDLILCDLTLEDMTGIALYRMVLSERPALASAFVFMTGGPHDEETTAFLSDVGAPIVYKPFDADRLRDLVSYRFVSAPPLHAESRSPPHFP